MLVIIRPAANFGVELRYQPVRWSLFVGLNELSVVLEKSNVAQLASALYLLVHSLPQEDRYDTDDASAREIYSILVPESTLCTVQLLRHRQYCASLLDWQGQAHRTVALHPVSSGVLR